MGGGMGDQKSKHQKHLSLGALLEAQLRKKCTPLWRESNLPRTLQRRRAFRSRKKRTRLRHEAHIKVKAAKSLHSRSTFERGAVVEKCILKSKFVKKNMQFGRIFELFKTRVRLRRAHFWVLDFGFARWGQ